MTKKEIIDLFMEFIHPSSAGRSKMSIHMDSQARTTKRAPGDPSAETVLACGTEQDGHTIDCDAHETLIKPSNVFVEDIVDWKARLICGPASRPVVKLAVASQ